MAESTFSTRAEQFYGELMREQYEVGAGLKEQLDLAPIYARYAELFSDAAVRERLVALRELETSSRPSGSQPNAPQDQAKSTAQLEHENAAKEIRHLADFATASYIENATKELTEKIANVELKAIIEWDGQQIPFPNVRSVLVRETNFRRRHDLQEMQLAVLAKQNPDRIKRIGRQHELAKQLGFVGYRGMIEQLRSWDLGILAKALGPLLKETEDPFEERLGLYLSSAHVPRNEADTSDVAYVLRATEFDSYFPGVRLLPVLEKTLKGLGLPLESTPGLHLDTDARPLKSPRAFCAPVRVPDDVYLVIKPVGGQDDCRALFHESGHAEHFTHVDADLPFAFRYLGEEAISETFAFLFEHLTSTPRWLVDVLRVPMREAERYRRFALFNTLWLVRRYAAKLNYELILHAEGPSGMDTAYRDILGDVLHVRIPSERYLEDVDDAFYVAGYLRAWIFERQLSDFLMNQFGEGWYESRDAGEFLRSMWSVGMRDPVDELARTRIGAKGLDLNPLVHALVEGR